MKAYLWIRVDDRLLHGQVALGWRYGLDPAAITIVDDATAGDPFASGLFRGALPEGLELAILGRDAFLDPSVARPDPARTILLVRGLAEMRSLCEGGFRPDRVNLGGLHHHEGARRYLDFIYLTERDVADIRWLLDRGIDVFAQDLPSSPRRGAAEFLDSGGSST